MFLRLGERGSLDHFVGHSDEGIPLAVCVMCGPTLVLRREDRQGGRIFCRNCGGEYALRRTESRELQTVPTGRRGNARDLAAEADVELIARPVRETTCRVPLPLQFRDVFEDAAVCKAKPQC